MDKNKKTKLRTKDKRLEAKWANQRKKKGFADVDVWSIDYWFLRTVPNMIDELIKIKHGWQPKLGYKIENKKLVKTKDNITYKQETQVLKYLSNGFRKLYSYFHPIE